ncbi:MAG: hypothetical protein QOF61_2572 [Acidobacteriota bacterium]|jgi:hypothetical protein|nr:hypothetical protein [Acidobacteriota bacterium]
MLDVRKIIAQQNRGILLDVVVFLFQLALMRVLVGALADLIREAQEDATAKAEVALFCLGLCFLQPVGAMLKRRRLSQRRADEENAYAQVVKNFGCYYLVAQLILMGAGISFIMGVFGKPHLLDSVWLGQLLVALPLAFLNLGIMSLSLTPPRRKPLSKFFASPQSEMLGDLCLFLNMILWQMFWGFLMSFRASSITDELIWVSLFIPQKGYTILAQLGWFILAFFIFYIPPRFIYLVEDKHRKVAWLTMWLANTPVVLRILLGRS